jgi:hypothetical protein
MNSVFPDRLRLPLAFDPERLAAGMANFSQAAWIEHFVRQNYDGDWDVIALRGPAGARHPIQMIYSDPACTGRLTLFPGGAGRLRLPAPGGAVDAAHPRLGDQGTPRQ